MPETEEHSTPGRSSASRAALVEEVLSSLKLGAASTFPICSETASAGLDPVFLYRALSDPLQSASSSSEITDILTGETSTGSVEIHAIHRCFMDDGMLSSDFEAMEQSNAHFARERRRMQMLEVIAPLLLLESAAEIAASDSALSTHCETLSVAASLGQYLISWYFPRFPEQMDSRSKSTGYTLKENITHLFGLSPIEISASLYEESTCARSFALDLRGLSRLDRAGATAIQPGSEGSGNQRPRILDQKSIEASMRTLRFADLLLSDIPPELVAPKLRRLSLQYSTIIASLQDQELLSEQRKSEIEAVL